MGMKYFVSWTHSDLVFSQFLPDVRVLVSPPNVNLAWQLSSWTEPPVEAIIDSGAFQYHREGRVVTPEAIVTRQLHMADAAIPTGICHLDVPMLGTRLLAELERRMKQNLQNAHWLINYVQTNGLPPHIWPIGVIQGYTAERVYVAARALVDMGYTAFALGSLAMMVASSRDEVLRRVEAALEAIDNAHLHILGVSSTTLLTDLARIGVRSADSGAPLHEAWRGGIFYSCPFQRYKLPTAYFKEWERSYSFAEVLAEPRPCDCPVCREDPTAILQPHGKRFVNLRGLHNYYHLVRELRALAQAAP